MQPTLSMELFANGGNGLFGQYPCLANVFLAAWLIAHQHIKHRQFGILNLVLPTPLMVDMGGLGEDAA